MYVEHHNIDDDIKGLLKKPCQNQKTTLKIVVRMAMVVNESTCLKTLDIRLVTSVAFRNLRHFFVNAPLLKLRLLVY
jgi:hypothetical protein